MNLLDLRGSAMVLLLTAGILLACTPMASEGPSLTVAISPDLPPYILDGATRGMEVDILREALPDHTLTFVQMPYAELQTAVPEAQAEVSAGVQHFEDDGVFYSENFITFVNAAIAKKSAGLEIESIADLAGHTVLTWQNAYRELGPEFEELYAPESPEREHYVEVADQREQVERFWQASSDVIVIDRAIFTAFSREMGHTNDEVDFHALFPPVTDFRVAFADASLRDAFDKRLTEMCESGAYQAILDRYQVALPKTICD